MQVRVSITAIADCAMGQVHNIRGDGYVPNTADPDALLPDSNVRALCIAGSAALEAMENGSAVGKSGDEPAAKVGEALLRGSPVDAYNVEELISSKYATVHLIKPGYELSKAEVEKNIEFAMEAERTVIYYSGHGARGTGDWCFESGGHQEYLLFEELIALWSESASKSLVVVVDACFSGCWVEKAKAININDLDGNKTSLEICASCHPDEKSWCTRQGSKIGRAHV